MRYHEIIEGPQEDLNQVQQAKKIVDAFCRWLANNNESTPIRDLPFELVEIGKGRQAYILPARTFGLRGYSDLYLGFYWYISGRGSTAGLMLRGDQPVGMFGDKRRVYYSMINVDGMIGDQTDFAYSIGTEATANLVHEVIHYLDFKRGYDKNGPNDQRDQEKHPKSGSNGYFNSPIERNAFFQMAIYKILQELAFRAGGREEQVQAFARTTLRSYKAFRREFMIDFRPEWIQRLSPTNKKRFEKRFYKLYTMIKADWPNIPQIQEINAEMEKWAQEAIAKDAA
jgi:hypothetical protein